MEMMIKQDLSRIYMEVIEGEGEDKVTVREQVLKDVSNVVHHSILI